MTDVVVTCAGDHASGWTCDVRVREGDHEASRHTVTLSAGDLARLAPGSIEPTRLVEHSFAFLLDREPPGSILRTFDLPAIGTYFPEYEREIRRAAPPG